MERISFRDKLLIKKKIMERLLKQAIGIDCAKDDFVASFGKYYENSEVIITATQNIKNHQEGFEKLESFIGKNAERDMPVFMVMEATGVYHEKLACYLYDKGYKVSVVLPQRAKAFMKTLKTKTVTDKESSKGLTIMGLEKKLDLWEKPDKIFNALKQITREREQVQKSLAQIKNQLHAEKLGAWPNSRSIERMESLKKIYINQIKEIEMDIKIIIKAHPDIEERINKIITAPGLGLLTVVTVVAETNGFGLIRNKRQLISYAGYDVVEKTSGTSVRGKAHISHKGNRHIRRAMHMPALTAIRHTDHNKALFVRLVSKHGIKMKGVVAVQRKLLVLIYSLWKRQESYDKSRYLSQKIEQPLKTALNELDHVRSLESVDSMQR
jgi:transposase